MAKRKKTSIKHASVVGNKSPYILVVEDEQTQALVIRHSLQSSKPNFAIKIVGTLKEYRSAVAESLPELVLIDIHLPDGKAFDVLTSPVEAGSFPLVAMTSYGNEKIAVRAMKAGAIDYIVKSPETLKEIPRTVDRVQREWRLIQERKQALEAMRESEFRFRSLYENVNIGLYRTTPEGKILLANRALVKMLGFSSFEKLSKRDLSKVGFEYTDQRKQFLNKINLEGEVNDFESAWQREDGSVLFVRESARAVRDSHGKILYYDGAVEDISEQKIAEAASKQLSDALRRMSRLYATLSQVNETIVKIKDKDQLFHEICRIAIEYGQFRMAWIGLMDEESGSVNPAASHGFEEGYLKHLDLNVGRESLSGKRKSDQTLREGKIVINDNSQVDPNMSPWKKEALKRGYLSSATVPFHFKGKVHGLLNLYSAEAGFFTDEELRLLEEIGANISFALDSMAAEMERVRAEQALHQSEERFRKVFEEGQFGMVLTTQDLKFFNVNPAFCNMLGYSYEEMTKKTFLDITHPDHRALDKEHVEQLWRGEVDHYKTEKRYIRKNGDVCWANLMVSLIKGYDGKPLNALAMVEDITERKRAEEALVVSEERLSTFMDSASDSFCLLDKNLNFVEINLKGLEILGKTRDEVIGKHMTEIMHDVKTTGRYEKHLEVLKTGVPFVAEQYLPHPTLGNMHFILKSFKAGEYLGVIGTDITMRKKVEEALRQSEARLNAFMKFVPALILIKDDEFRPIYANERFASLFPINDWLGKKPTEIFPPQVADLMIQKDTEAMEKGYTNYEEKWVDKEGGQHVFLTQKFKIMIPGVKSLLGAIISDITERKRAEEELSAMTMRQQAILSAVPDIIMEVDNNKIYTWANNAGMEFFGDDVLGKEAAFYFDGNQDTYTIVEPVFQGDEKIKYVESWQRRKDGKRRLLAWWCRVLKDKQGNVTGVLSSARDITDYKQTEEVVRQMQKLEGLGTLAGGIAHDFNNILGIILAYVTNIHRHKHNPEKIGMAADTILKAVDRGKTLVQQVLTFARKTETEFELVNINDIIVEIMTMILETFPKMLSFSQKIDKDIPAVFADRSQVHQAILNLCVNARDAMQKGGVLTVSSRAVSGDRLREKHKDASEKAYACVEVGDTGEGMTEEIKERIFEPFFTTKEKGKGTGLGLAVVFGVIQTHKGFIDVESEQGKGTLFRLYLPASSHALPIPVEQEESFEDIPGGSETLLVVEDEEMLMTFLLMVLNDKGYTVLTAKDGLSALQVFRKHQENISLILTDLGLPGISGLDVSQQIRQIKPDVQIILATGYLDPEMKSESIKKSINKILAKPYEPKEVLKAIRQVLDRK